MINRAVLILSCVLPVAAFTSVERKSSLLSLVSTPRARAWHCSPERRRPPSFLESTKLPRTPPSSSSQKKLKIVKKDAPNDEDDTAAVEDQIIETATPPQQELPVLTDDGDEALRLMSSEVGVRRALGRQVEPSFPLFLLIERTLDTIEDVVLHLRRIPYDLGWQPEPPTDEKRKTIVILGSGWAAHALMK